MLDELLEIALTVRYEPDHEPVTPQLVERGERVLVEREVLVPLPFTDHLGRTRACSTGIAPHPENDLLGERDPDLLVVNEIAIVLQRLDRARTGVVIATRSSASPCRSPSRR